MKSTDDVKIIKDRKWFKVDYLSHCMQKHCRIKKINQILYYSPGVKRS